MKPVQLTIPTPCHESWDKMTPRDQGRFCASCEKVVVDFSAMSDAQLIQYFENLQSENVCGRVYPDQLNRQLETPTVTQPRKKIGWFWQVAAAFSLFFFRGQAVKAQGKVAVRDTTKKIKSLPDQPIRLGGIRRVYPDTVAKMPAQLSQVFITDDRLRPVAYASVQLFPQGNWIMADSVGKISLGIAHAVKSIKITSLGFEEKLVELKSLEGNAVVLKAIPVQIDEVVVQSSAEIRGKMVVVAGGISVTKSESTQPEEIKLIAERSSKNTFPVFPNPATKGRYVSINIPTNKPTEFALLITDINGKTMLQQNINVVSKMQPIKLMVPANWASGQYYISIRSAKEQTMQTASLIVL